MKIQKIIGAVFLSIYWAILVLTYPFMDNPLPVRYLWAVWLLGLVGLILILN